MIFPVYLSYRNERHVLATERHYGRLAQQCDPFDYTHAGCGLRVSVERTSNQELAQANVNSEIATDTRQLTEASYTRSKMGRPSDAGEGFRGLRWPWTRRDTSRLDRKQEQETPPSSPKKAFISYSRADHQVAWELNGVLKSLGYEPWYDQSLTGGQDWWDVILEHICECDLFVFVLSLDSLSSRACQQEFGYAHQLLRRVLPVLISDEVNLAMLPEALQRIQVVDYRSERRIERLREAVNSLPPPRPLPDPLPPPPTAPVSPLGRIGETIARPSLSLEMQSTVLLELKGLLSDPDTNDAARTLFLAFRKRGDLLAAVATEIDQALDSSSARSAASMVFKFVDPSYDFDDIGGQEPVKNYLRERVQMVAARNQVSSVLIPSALLFVGPAGTGKLQICDALAHESGFRFVRMRLTGGMPIERMETDLERSIARLKSYAPVIVLVPAVDQVMGSRASDPSTSAMLRIFARLLELTSDNRNRGRILWLMTSDRPDLLDDALLRRFDRVVPMLPPDIRSACAILAIMPRSIGKQSGGTLRVTYSPSIGEDGTYQPTWSYEAFKPIGTEMVKRGYTGHDVAKVVQQAVEYASARANTRAATPSGEIVVELSDVWDSMNEYKTRQSIAGVDLQSLFALRASNSRSLIPPLPEREIYRSICDETGHIDFARLDQAIRHSLHKLGGE